MSDPLSSLAMDDLAQIEDPFWNSEITPASDYEPSASPPAAVLSEGTAAPSPVEGPVTKSIRTDGSVDWQRAIDPKCARTVRAEVDFIDFKIQLVRPTRREGIIERCGPGASIPSNRRLAGNVLSEFVVRIQDPTPSRCRSCLKGLNRRFPFASDPEIVAVEVSMDFYVPQASIAELGRLTARLYHFSRDKPVDRHRIANGTGAYPIPDTLDDLYEAMASAQHSIYVGSQRPHWGKPSDPISYRYYVKTTDMNKAFVQNQFRARMEVTLQHDAVPFRTLDEMDQFEFQNLASHFKFWRVAPEDKLTVLQRQLYCRYPGISRGSKKPKPPKGIRARDRRSDRVIFVDELGNETLSALRSLTKRWKTSARTYKA